MKADINVTPFIDVLLVLLIIFLVVAPVAPTALGASVPERKTGPGSHRLVLEIEADHYALNTTPLSTKQVLRERLREAMEVRGDRTLFVRVGKRVVYDRVVEALDVAREAGAERIGLVDNAAR